MRKPILITSFLLSIVILLAVVQVMMTNRLSTNGVELSELQVDLVKYKRENALIKEKLLTASSLTNIAEKAKEEGFIPSTQAYFSTPLPLALKR